MIKGDFNDGRVPTHIKRQKTMKRIQEWERFEESCLMIKEMDNEQIEKISELQKERRVRAGSVGALRDVWTFVQFTTCYTNLLIPTC